MDWMTSVSSLYLNKTTAVRISSWLTEVYELVSQVTKYILTLPDIVVTYSCFTVTNASVNMFRNKALCIIFVFISSPQLVRAFHHHNILPTSPNVHSCFFTTQLSSTQLLLPNSRLTGHRRTKGNPGYVSVQGSVSDHLLAQFQLLTSISQTDFREVLAFATEMTNCIRTINV